MMIQTRTSQLRLIFMVSCYPMLRVNTNRGDKILLHGPKNTTEAMTISDSDGPLVLPPLPPGHTFVVTSSLMQILTARALFSGLPSEDPHAHIAKVSVVCKSCVGRLDLDLDVIGLKVFPFSLTGETAIWFTKLPYNSIFTWNQLRVVFLARYYPVSKKLNHKDRVNNFVALPRESVSSSWIDSPRSWEASQITIKMMSHLRNTSIGGRMIIIKRSWKL